MNGENTISTINAWAVSLVGYIARILKWIKDEKDEQNTKTRKIITMNRMYHPQSDTDRLYIPII